MDSSERYRIIESYLLSVVRRIIPGEYTRLCDVRVDKLKELGIDFTRAAILPPTNLFQDIVHGGKTARKTIDALVDNEGSWHFALSARDASSAGDLQLAIFTKEPHPLVMGMLDTGALKAPLIVMAGKGGHFLILNGIGLKALARSSDAATID